MIRFLASVLLLFAAALASAQRHALDEPRFTSVVDNRAIGDGVVTALAQDETGFLWVGTAQGLARYDGYQLRSYPVGAAFGQTGRGASRFVRVLLAAPGGILWAGLEGEGLARLDTASQQWTLYKPDPARPGALAHGTVRALAIDADGVLWVGTTGGGLQSLAPQAQTFERHGVANQALPDDRVQALRVDRRGTLWVGTWRGLVRKARGESGFQPAFSTPGTDGLAGRQVTMLGEGPDGRVWAGTRDGDLAIIEPASGAGAWVERAQSSALGAPASGPGGAASFVVASQTEVWIGRERGLDLRNANTGALVSRLRRAANKPWGLAGHNVVALLRDASGLLWVGSYGGGLQHHNPSAGLWVRRGDGPEGSAFSEGDVRSLQALDNGEIWAGTPAGAVLVFDSQLRLRAQILPAAPAPASGRRAAPAPGFVGGLVGAIAQARDGTVWVGSDSGIHAFSADRRLLARHAVGAGRTRRLLAASDGSIWAGTQDGVYRLRPGAQDFERLGRADDQALSGNVNALAQTADGAVWVGANGGLWRVPPGHDRLQAVTSPAQAGLRSTVVLGLLVDRRNQLWVDTNAGLHRCADPGSTPASFEALGQDAANGGGSFGANLLEDARGRIWTHRHVYDPQAGSQHELGPGDGVDIGTGWFRAYTALADGRMLFGGSTGILVVEPARLQPWTFQPPVAISDLRIDGERQPASRLTPALVLGPEQRAVSLEFAALDFSQPDGNRYRYRLAGVDRDWVTTGSDFRVASYSNLAPGDYRLQLQGSNRMGAWSPHTLSLTLQVLPAWWQTWWARAAALSLAGAAVWMVVQLRTRLLRRQQAVLELKVRERTQALEALSRELQRKSAALETTSLTDPLTGLHNRRFLTQHMAGDAALVVRRHGDWRPERATTESANATAAGPDIVFFLIDIDHFKAVNDQHGHAAGDAVLLQVCERLQQAFREADYVVRWGGEEFLVAARGTARERAFELAERARQSIAQQPFVLDDGTPLWKTCSVGFSAFPLAPGLPGALDWTTSIDLADAALYAVKHGGRDGWFGLLQARAVDAAALRQAAASPLHVWIRSGDLQVLGSRDFSSP